MVGGSFGHGRSGDRVGAELLAKVLGLVVLHWATLTRGPALSGLNATRLMRKVAEFARQMGRALAKGEEALWETLREMAEEMARVEHRRKRRRKPGTKDLLENPGLASRNC